MIGNVLRIQVLFLGVSLYLGEKYTMSDQSAGYFSLGLWMRRRRKALDLTQAALADCVGCAVVSIRKMEADAMRPSPAMAQRLAQCFDLAPDERTAFLEVARGERGRARFLTPLMGVDRDLPPPDSVSRPPHVVALPLDTLPNPALLPPGSRMPLSRNPLFVGRERDLRQLAHALSLHGTAAIGQVETAAATGLGGIGKTQLACEFVHRYGQFFAGGVFWLSFADSSVVRSEIAACGGVDGMRLGSEFDQLPLDKQVQRVLVEWYSPLPRLLVFDNCEDESLLHQWRPKHGGSRVLLTSRRRYWGPALGVHAVPLDVLPRIDSLALLRAFRPDLSEHAADLQTIAEVLGDLPLALHLAGNFLARYHHALTPTQYLERLQTPTILDDRSLKAAGLSPTAHVQHVARTFEQSYERLDAADPTDALALTLLAQAACCAPGEPIPRRFLLQTLQLPEDDAEPGLLAEDALLRLTDLGLLDTDVVGNLRLHRLLVAFVRTVSDHTAAQTAVEATLLRVAEALNDQRNPRLFLALQPHLRVLIEAALGRADARTAALCDALGVHLWLLGGYDEAQGYLEQAVAIRQRVLGLEHPDTVRSFNRLGGVLWAQGHYAEAQGYLEQALAIRQRVLGEDHPDTALSLTSLGVVLAEQGRYAEAQRAHAQALAIKARVLGEDHPRTATSLNNLGDVYESQGHYAAAQRHYEQALAIWQRVMGEDHPDTALSLNNLGDVYASQGHYAAAQRHYERALAIRQRILGTEHPHTALSLRALGAVLQAQGQHAEAQGYLEQAVAIQQRVLEPDHPDTARSLRAVGELLHAQGETAQARVYLEQALAIVTQRLGAEHPDTAESLHQLGRVLHTLGQYAAARRALEQALVIYEQAVGSEHPGPQDVRASLAALLDQY
ncbi:MAG TPA: FxSxx-COOH system tetratricopeptide repeat protein [Herpetosiphonaceae bacterium]